MNTFNKYNYELCLSFRLTTKKTLNTIININIQIFLLIFVRYVCSLFRFLRFSTFFRERDMCVR